MIDGCLVINLQHRTDRLNLFDQQRTLLRALGLNPERLEGVHGRILNGYGEEPWFTKRLKVKRAHAWAGKAGCTLSHRRAIATAKERGWKNVLILEDDSCFEPSITAQWEQLLVVMRTLPEDWIAIYLYGHHPVSPTRIIKAHTATTCYEICGASSTTAYLLNGRYFDKLLNCMPQQKEIWAWTARYKTVDRWFSRRLCAFGRVYAMAPFGISHRVTPSDITTTGESEPTPSFKITSDEEVRCFEQKRWMRRAQQTLALASTWFRLLYKCLKGL